MRVLRKETALSQEIALLKETNNQIAVRHGLPPVGSTMINQYGIEWLVDGHVFVPTLSTLARGTNLEEDDPRDLYPVILPQNLSPRLTNFIAETDRCTSKVIMPLDTLPYLRPHSSHPYGHWIDGLDSPHRILMFLDAAHAHETIIAHEIGHIWIDLVEDCEDYRIFKDLSDTPKVHQWTSLQSFVLDNKVNEVLREKGFAMSVIENDVEESLISFAAAIRSGYRPPTAREAAFVASTLATAMLDYETGAQNALQSLDMASTVFRQDLPDVYELACQLAASVRRHGYADRASVRKAVDECALLAFAFVGEPLDLDTDFVEEVPTEDYNDKYPEYFSGLPVPAKLEIARAMARLKIPGGSECRLEYSSTGSAHVKFCQRSGDWTKPVLLKNLRRLPRATAFIGSSPMLQRGRPNMNKLPLGISSSNSPQSGTTLPVISPPLGGIQPASPTFPLLDGNHRGRSYGPGLARFLSQARLAEQLGGEHPYGYALNNPLTNSDPSGLEPNRNSQVEGRDMITVLQKRKKAVFLLALLCASVAMVTVIGRCFQRNQRNADLISALKSNNVGSVLSLLAQGADANTKDLPKDTRTFRQQILDLFHGGRRQVYAPSALIVTLRYGMDGSYDIDKYNPPDNVEEVRALLDHGAKMNIRDEHELTPLMIAAVSGKFKTAQLLIRRGADINAENERMTVLMEAVLWGREKICELLLENGATIDTQDRDGRTALMRAISGQFEEAVKLLLVKKANVNLRARNGETALSIAERKLPDFVPLLKKAGAFK